MGYRIGVVITLLLVAGIPVASFPGTGITGGRFERSSLDDVVPSTPIGPYPTSAPDPNSTTNGTGNVTNGTVPTSGVIDGNTTNGTPPRSTNSTSAVVDRAANETPSADADSNTTTTPVGPVPGTGDAPEPPTENPYVGAAGNGHANGNTSGNAHRGGGSGEDHASASARGTKGNSTPPPHDPGEPGAYDIPAYAFSHSTSVEATVPISGPVAIVDTVRNAPQATDDPQVMVDRLLAIHALSNGDPSWTLAAFFDEFTRISAADVGSRTETIADCPTVGTSDTQYRANLNLIFAVTALYDAMGIVGLSTDVMNELEANVYAVPPDVAGPLACILWAVVTTQKEATAVFSVLTPDDIEFLQEVHVNGSMSGQVGGNSVVHDLTVRQEQQLEGIEAKVDANRLFASTRALLHAIDVYAPELASYPPDLQQHYVCVDTDCTDKGCSYAWLPPQPFEFCDPLQLVIIGGHGPNTYNGNKAEFVPVLGPLVFKDKFGPNATVLVIDRGATSNDWYFNSAGGAGAEDYQTGSVQGWGNGLAVSVNVDLGGNDNYVAPLRMAQGGGRLGGIGILSDWGGNDVYRGTAYQQGYAADGIGLLFDLGGDDAYTLASSFGQGFGTGLAYTMAAFVDLSGNDIYGAAYGSAQGSASGSATGISIDLAGNDQLKSQGSSAGSGRDSAVAVFLNARGADSYAGGSNGFGYCTSLCKPSVFLDIGGVDRYSPCQNCLVTGNDQVNPRAESAALGADTLDMISALMPFTNVLFAGSNTLPTSWIDASSGGASVTATGRVTDPDEWDRAPLGRIEAVELRLTGAGGTTQWYPATPLESGSFESGWSGSVATTGLAAGSYTLEARAHDGAAWGTAATAGVAV